MDKIINLFKQNSIRQNVKITKKLFVHVLVVLLELLYIISFCFDDSFDPYPEVLARFL